MIGFLYRRYRRQIAVALFLVIAENVTFISEPYVFGLAIDNLREANKIENVVDSSETDFLIRNTVDSLREHLLDSLLNQEKLHSQDSVVSFHSQLSNSYIIPAVYQAQGSTHASRRKRDSLRKVFDSTYKKYIEGRAAEIPDSVHGAIAVGARHAARRHELIRRSLAGSKKKTGFNRDSARKAIRHESSQRESIGQTLRADKPFSFTRDVSPFLPPLLPWVILFVSSSILGGVRRRYDTRVYSGMFAELSSTVVDSQLKRGEAISKVAGRSDIAYSNIEFFQYNLPEFIEQIISVAGAVVALSLFDWRLAVIGGSLLSVIALASRLYMAKVERVQEEINNLKEKEYDTFMTSDPNRIKDYYWQHTKYEIRLSKLGAASHWIVRSVMLAMFLGTLYISLDLDRFTIGELYSIVAYVWTFVTASEYIPYLSEKWVNLRDTSRRIGLEFES